MQALLKLVLENGAVGQAILAVCAVMLALVLLMLFMVLGARESKQRLQRLNRVSMRPSADADAGQTKLSVRRSTTDSSIAWFDRLIKRAIPNPTKMRARLARTGKSITIGQYLLVCLLVVAIATALVHFIFGVGAAGSLLFGLVIGVGLPHLVIGYLGKRRINRFTALFCEAIDLIVRGLKSGLPITESIKVVGTEIKDPVGIEFRQVSDAIKFGLTMNEALEQASARIDTPEFRFFIITLAIQQETGGNLAETLEGLSNVIRRRRQMKLKIKAYSSEAKASAYIIGSLPFIMFGIILMMNYGYISTLWTDSRGMIMVGIGLISYVIGIGVMAKMVRFEI